MDADTVEHGGGGGDTTVTHTGMTTNKWQTVTLQITVPQVMNRCTAYIGGGEGTSGESSKSKYSRTSLIRTPKGQSKVSVLERSRRLRHF